MSIKPVAWMYQHEEKPKLVNVTDVRLNAKTRNPLYEEIPLYAIPDTHRVVSVELLRRAELSLCKEAQGAVTKEWDGPLNFAEQLRAIIEDKPCSQS